MAGNRGLCLVFCKADRPLETTGFGTRHITGHAADLGIIMGIHHNFVVGAEQLEDRVYFTKLLSASMSAI